MSLAMSPIDPKRSEEGWAGKNVLLSDRRDDEFPDVSSLRPDWHEIWKKIFCQCTLQHICTAKSGLAGRTKWGRSRDSWRIDSKYFWPAGIYEGKRGERKIEKDLSVASRASPGRFSLIYYTLFAIRKFLKSFPSIYYWSNGSHLSYDLFERTIKKTINKIYIAAAVIGL